METVEEANALLQKMDWLGVAGAAQHVGDLSECQAVVDYSCNWLCLGRTRPALERYQFIMSLHE